MVALWNRADHYIFILFLSFFFLLFLFPCLISVVGDWMSTILLHMVWPSCETANLECRSEMCCMWLAENTGRKNDAKNRHLGTIPQHCRAIYRQGDHHVEHWPTFLVSSCFFLLPLLFLFPRLISAFGDWMSAMVWP